MNRRTKKAMLPSPPTSSPPSGAPQLVNAHRAAELLAISERKLWELTSLGEIPRVPIGRAVRYDVADLAAWVAQQKERSRR